MAYLTRKSLKVTLKIEADDTTRDDLVDEALASAEEAIHTHCGRTFSLDGAASARTFPLYRRVVRTIDGQKLMLNADIGSSTGLIVEYGSGSSWTDVTTSVELDPLDALTRGRGADALLLVGRTWPVGGGSRARVTARWGWPTVPAMIITVTRILATRFFKRKDSPEGIIGSADWGVVRIPKVDPDMQALLFDYVAPWK